MAIGNFNWFEVIFDIRFGWIQHPKTLRTTSFNAEWKMFQLKCVRDTSGSLRENENNWCDQTLLQSLRIWFIAITNWKIYLIRSWLLLRLYGCSIFMCNILLFKIDLGMESFYLQRSSLALPFPHIFGLCCVRSLELSTTKINWPQPIYTRSKRATEPAGWRAGGRSGDNEEWIETANR